MWKTTCDFHEFSQPYPSYSKTTNRCNDLSQKKWSSLNHYIFINIKGTIHLIISLIDNGSSSKGYVNEKFPSRNPPKSLMATRRQEEDKSILGLQDNKNVKKISNVKLPLVVNVAITNHLVLRISTDDGSSCDSMYINIFMKLGLRNWDLMPYEGKNLLTLNDFTTRSCEAI